MTGAEREKTEGHAEGSQPLECEYQFNDGRCAIFKRTCFHAAGCKYHIGVKNMKIYLAGKITGDPLYRTKFDTVAKELEKQGHIVMNPAVMPDGFEYEEYMQICFKMIDICNVVCMLPDWSDSPGAKREREKAKRDRKPVMYLHHKNDKWSIMMTKEVDG